VEHVDCLVIGAGAVGLAIARRMALAGLETVVLERESKPGSQTSSRNSEVIHAGIYYAPGSLKARLCVRGRQQLYAYCQSRSVAHARCGKLIVATADEECATLQKYLDTARRNGVNDLVWRTPAEIAVLEPAVRCTGALWSPSSGIFDSHEFIQALIGDFEAEGGLLACSADVVSIHLAPDGHRVAVVQQGEQLQFRARLVVNAAGLSAWQLARATFGLPTETIPPRYLAKGYYFTHRGRAPFRHLVYPVASSAGLGIHVTIDLAGAVRFGPDVEWQKEVDYVFDDTRRHTFATAIRRYYPTLDESRLESGYTGVRPKVSGPGEPAGDFLLQGPADHGWTGLMNLYGIESPGLTAALAIGDEVAVRLGVVSSAHAEPIGHGV